MTWARWILKVWCNEHHEYDEASNWGNESTLTLDDDRANDVGVAYLKKKFLKK